MNYCPECGKKTLKYIDHERDEEGSTHKCTNCNQYFLITWNRNEVE